MEVTYCTKLKIFTDLHFDDMRSCFHLLFIRHIDPTLMLKWTTRLGILRGNARLSGRSFEIGVHQGPAKNLFILLQHSMKLVSLPALLKCFNFSMALASICRILSRVTSSSSPTSPRVCSCFIPIPNRIRRTFSSL